MNKRQLSTIILSVLMTTMVCQAQDTGYKQPDQKFVDIAFAKSSPRVQISPDKQWMLFTEQEPYSSVATLAEDELRLAGYRINPQNFSRSRQSYITALTLENIADRQKYDIKSLPANVLISTVSWSPNSKNIALAVSEEDGVYLWFVDMATKEAKKVSNRRINGTNGVMFEWLSDTEVITTLVPENIGNAPAKPRVPAGPTIQENLGKAKAAPTYQDLLKNAYDEAMYQYYFTAELARIDNVGTVTKISTPMLLESMELSPDAEYLLLETIQKPFSYTTTARSFPKKIYIVKSRSGETVKDVIDLPLITTAIGYDMASPYPRNHAWRADKAATLYWAEAQDKGNPRENPTKIKDIVYQLDAPFTGEKSKLIETEMRYGGIIWGNDDLAIVSENSRATRRTKSYRFAPGNLAKPMTMIFDRSTDDNYANLGQPVTVRNAFGSYVLWSDKKNNELLLTSTGASSDGDMPYISRFDMTTLKNTILWRCVAPYYETIATVLDPAIPTLLTARQSTTEPINYYLRNLKKGTDEQLTAFVDAYKASDLVTKQKISYKRADGIDMTATLYLPVGYDPAKDGRLPVYMWAYPREYSSASDAAQVRGSKYTYTPLSYRGQAIWATRGYAVMDEVEMPIVGEEGKEPNDNFLNQLTMNAEAAIKVIVDMGIGDRNRMAVGGHSYGAFMTANLLTHTNLFKAGIARSGAYNRTLTPFGFQAETRTYWEAPEVYNTMSPFMYADKLSGALLLVHGELDNNTGTFPVQSERFFAALQGNGGNVRYVVLPYESHGYTGKENNLHLLWETETWLDNYVKNAK